ncbi:MAG: aldehyde ferredoxin oxidoreductase family protein [Acidobacteria bacterium]|nr:aldehyde ferredoxin oxidoreductase family protein [Acidobacteriota bacterium]
MNGYGGTILRINLTTGKIEKTPTDPEVARSYLGGRGFAAYYLFREVPKGADPLGPENKLLMVSGILSGMFAPGGGKTTFAAKSPATGSYGDSNVGGHLSAEMKFAGYDMVILEGVADKPTVVVITDDEVELIDGSKYWGKGAITAEKMLKDDLGEDYQIAVIGPAGENLIPISCISHDFGRQAGRTGVGAVMGSKKVKAIAVKGTKGVPVHDFEGYVRQAKEMFRIIAESPATETWIKYGTPGVVEWVNEIGAFPVRNFSSGWLAEYKNLSGPVMREEIVKIDKGCHSCPSPCGKYSHFTYKGKEFYVEGPEYETIALIGGNVGFTNIKDVAYANYLVDELGLDSISAGNICAFAIECFERGIITEKDTDGIKLSFGDPEGVYALIEKIAKKEGIGAILAKGVREAAKEFGGGSEKFAIQVKGLEVSGYEFHHAPAMALAYMTTDIGAHHNRAWAITYDIEVGRDKVEGKAAKVIELQHIRPLFDMLGACRLQWVEVNLPLETYPPLINAITGFDYDLEGYLKTSERVWNLTRCFWVREYPDFGRSWDYPPARFIEDPIPDGPTKGAKLTKEMVEALLDDYYKLRGWDKNGIPTEAKLSELGLDFAIEELKKAGRL